MARKALFLFAFAWVLTTNLLGEKKPDFQPGKFLSVTTDDQVTKKETIRTAIFTIQVGDLVYTAKGERVKPKSGDLGEGLIVGDPVQTAIDGKDLILIKPNGKELKLKISKRERAPK
jgi:hypothetical protein